MSRQSTIVIVDYGVGNLHSVSRVFSHCGAAVKVSEDAADIEKADALVLPGVGSFMAGMNGLAIRQLTAAVKHFALTGRPLLGICLGAQLFLETGYEFGEHQGLGLISGSVLKFHDLAAGEKIPHIGWNEIWPSSHLGIWQQTPLEHIQKNDRVYFVHSYILQPSNAENILAFSNYGGQKFCAAVRAGNIFGFQFHPEKSGQIGLSIIKDFIKLLN